MSTEKPLIFRFAAAWALQLLGTTLLLACMYWWLTWPDEQGWQVAASALMALLLLAGVACMERTVFAAHYESSARLLPRPTISSCAAFASWLVVFVFVEMGFLRLKDGAESAAVRIAQILHLPPRLTTNLLEWGLCAFIWLLVPALMLPFASLLSDRGFVALRLKAIFSALGVLRYWGGLCLAIAGVYASIKLIDWIPGRHTLRGEMWSAGLRLGVAYIVVVTAITFVAWNTRRAILPDDSGTEGGITSASS